MGSAAKFLSQTLVALIAVLWLYKTASTPAELQFIVPLFKNIVFDLSWLFIPLSWFVIVGSSNAVNLTDGLDGLANITGGDGGWWAGNI